MKDTDIQIEVKSELTLEDLVVMTEQLKVAREKTDEVEKLLEPGRQVRDEAIEDAKAQFNQNYRVALQRLDECIKSQADIEQELRKAMIDYAVANDVKKINDELMVKEVTALEYSADLALMWAIDHRIALKLDERMFSKLVRTLEGTDYFPQFVNIIINHQTSISKKLK